jgi:hypothetical protein
MLGSAYASPIRPDTSRTEREAFFRRLRTEPPFLLRHFRTLAWAVFRRLRTKLLVRFSGTHQGRKIQPAWLDAATALVGSSPAAPVCSLTLPRYACSAESCADGSTPALSEVSLSSDPEDYLAAHRWGMLTDSLLARSVDWQERLAECVRWIEDHPDKADPAWESYSSCERVANLLVFLAAMQATPHAASVPRQLPTFLQDSLGWILRNLEYYGPSETNNHIINNARAVVMAGVALGDSTALAAGMQIFRRCLPGLIMDGGFLRERSSHYQVIVLSWVLDAWWFLGVREDPGTEDRQFLGAHVERMIAATSMICERGTRLLSLIGDVSPDLTPAQSLARLTLLYPDFWPPSQEVPAGARVTDGWFRITSGESLILGNFPAGSFPARFPTHGHGDLTSFAWLHGGREILVDCGRYRYTPDAISAFQKCASAHNLPLVNGLAPLCESLVAGGNWWPLPYAEARLEASVSGAGVLLAHDGFARATPVRDHKRSLRLEQAALVIEDNFVGTGKVEVGFCWHFGDGFDTFDTQSLAVSGSDGRIGIKVEGVAGAVHAAIVLSAARGQGGWISRAYGHKQPALGICLRWEVNLPALVSTRFSVVSRELMGRPS